MMYFTLILVLATSALASNVKLRDGIVPQKLTFAPLSEAVLPHIPWERLKEIVETEGQLQAGYIEADVTKYAHKVIGYIDKFIVEKGLDPLHLNDSTTKLIPTGTLKLTDGWLENLSALNISEKVIARYIKSTKVLELTLPLSFRSLLITYDYTTHIVLLNIHGTIDAKIKDVNLNLRMGFNFSSFQAFVDKADIKDSGKVTINFTGHGLVDWVINLLLGVVTTLLHGIIVAVINYEIQDPVDSVVDAINNFINQILKRSATDLLTY